jgi:hypothetical protein
MLYVQSYTHGHSVHEQDASTTVVRLGMNAVVSCLEIGTNPHWFHFAIPTPVMLNLTRIPDPVPLLQVPCVWLRYMVTNPGGGGISQVDVYDAEKKLWSQSLTPPKAATAFTTQIFEFKTVNDKIPAPVVQFGLGVSVMVTWIKPATLSTQPMTVYFSSAGADFRL